MSTIWTISLAVAIIGLAVFPLSAAPTSLAPLSNATPLTQLAQGYFAGGHYYPSYHTPCAYRYHRACWNEANGHKRCGCKPN